MLEELLEVGTKLFEFSDRWAQAEEKKRQRIENFFLRIEQCLRDSVEQLKIGKKPSDKWEELKTYAEELPKTIIDEIGEHKAQELRRLLKITASNTPVDDSYIESIEKAAGRFKALSVIVATVHRPPDIEAPQSSQNPLLDYISPSRRAFIWTTVGTSVGLGAGWLSRQNTSMPTIKWKMVSLFGENTKKLIIHKVPQIISDRLKEMTDGCFTIDIDTKSAIQTEDILKMVDSGTIQCGFSGIYYIQDRYKVLFFGCAIPFGLSPQEHSAWLLYKKNPDDKLSFMQRVYSEKLNLKVIAFPVAATGGQMGGWFNQEVNSVADFNGLIMRIPGFGGEILRKYFGVTIDRELPGGAIPIDKIKEELAKGTVKAAEWIGPYDDYQLGLHEVAKYYYYPGWWEPSTTFDVLVNQSEWDKLPLKYQEIFKAVCLETYTKILAEYDIKNSETLQELRKLEQLGNIQLVRFSDQILREAQDKTNALLKLYSSNTTFKEVYDEWNSFKRRIRNWSNLNKI
jgi:TRAP-type mannitol/chloroaromatic compound transport system substrate-binding protein